MEWFLIFDTETTGLPLRYDAPPEDLENWPRLVQLAWQLHDPEGKLGAAKNYIIRPEGFTIPYSAEKVHGISTSRAMEEGLPLADVLGEFAADVGQSRLLIGHNIDFDINIVAAEFIRKGIANPFPAKPVFCTKIESTDFCALPGGKGGRFKWPTLAELHRKLFDEDFTDAHNASADVIATARCFLELARQGVARENKLRFTPEEYRHFLDRNPSPFVPAGVEIIPNAAPGDITDIPGPGEADAVPVTADIPFTHLHVHTQYSILDGAASIPEW